MCTCAGYRAYVEPATLHFGSAFATEALLSAYDAAPSAAWLDAARSHVCGNIDCLSRELERHLAGLVTAPPSDATYLVWLDCTGLARRLGLTTGHALEGFMLEAGLCLSPGHEFCADGHADLCMRLNAACPRATIEEAARRLRDAVERAALNRKCESPSLH